MTDQLERFQRARGTLYRWIGGDALLAAPDRDDFDLLAGAGSAVWHFLDVPRTVPELVRMTAEIYDMRQEEIARDIETLVDDLVARGLIEKAIDA